MDTITCVGENKVDNNDKSNELSDLKGQIQDLDFWIMKISEELYVNNSQSNKELLKNLKKRLEDLSKQKNQLTEIIN